MDTSTHNNQAAAPVHIADHVSLFILEDHGVFFSTTTQELQLFNGPATYVWCSLEEGLSPDAIISAYADVFGVPRASAQAQVIGLLHRWQGLGHIDGIDISPPTKIDLTTALGRLLSNPSLRQAFATSPLDTARRLALRESDIEIFTSLDPKELENQAQMLEAKKRKFRHRESEIGNAATASFIARSQTREWVSPTRTRHYRLLTTYLSLRFATAAQEKWVHPALAHLETDATVDADLTLDIIEEPCGNFILKGGVLIGFCENHNQLAREILMSVREIATERARFFIQIHAGVVSNGTHCVLLPAAQGGGKSTLTAALVRSGFRYFTDETALLEEKTLHVRAVPLALTLKPGSVTPLDAYYPDLSDLPLHFRDDELGIRYLAPPAENRCSADEPPAPVRWIVFPRYTPSGVTSLQPIGKGEALRRLMDECSALQSDLDQANVADLIAWIRGIDCFDLPISSLPEAVHLLRDLCFQERDPA